MDISFESILIAAFLLILGLGIFALSQLALAYMKRLSTSDVAAQQDVAVIKKIAREKRLSDDMSNQVATLLEQRVVNDELYRQPDINLRSLASKIGVSPHDLSDVLNAHMNTTFYSYINMHRVTYAESLLSHSNDAVIDVAINSGFNSKTSFYNAFKKHYGETPAQFRSRQHRLSGVAISG